MMDRLLRLALIVLTAGGLAACEEDSAAPVGETSTVTVNVFVEDDGTAGMSAGDDPIAGATVTLTAVGGSETLNATTGADGVATFSAVPAGVYTLTHTPNPAITNATLTSTASQTLVAQFEGGTTTASFVYAYNPGSLAGQIFRDENDNDTYEEADDTTLAGFQLILFAGNDTILTGTETSESITAGANGQFTFDDLAPGDYTLLIRPIVGTEVADTVLAISIAPDEHETLLIEFTGGEAVLTVAQVRALPAGSTVTTVGVVTAGVNVYNTAGFYFQDATGGIAVFQGGAADTLGLTQGDSITITGVTGANAGEIQIAGGAALEIEVLGTGTIPTPRTVTATDVNAGLFQGELVRINAFVLDSLNASSGAFSFNENVFGHDGTGNAIIFIDGTTGIDSTYINFGETYNITGIMTRFNALLEIKPRSPEDLDMTSVPAGTIPIAQARLLPDGAGPVTVTGVVTAGTGTYNATTAYIQDNTAGIVIDQFGRTTLVPMAVGDSITITAPIDIFNAEPRMQGNNTATITNHGPVVPRTAVAVTCAEINNGARQGELTVLNNATVISFTGTTNLTYVVEDATDRCTVFVDVDTGITAANLAVGSRYNITGALASFNALRQTKPRNVGDIVLVP